MTTSLPRCAARIGVWILLAASSLPAARPRAHVTVSHTGVPRWSDSASEVALFGVNYYAPFALDFQRFRAAVGAPEEALVTALTHLHRLGIDALRLHCWDRGNQ